MSLDRAWLYWAGQLRLAWRGRRGNKGNREWIRTCVAELRQINAGLWFAY